jgi:hypothetical protein
MKTTKRMAAIVTPKAPFFAWAALFLDERPPDCTREEDFRTVFLLPDRDDIEQALESVYADIFAEMSESWINAPELWLTLETLESFHKWFEVEIVRTVVDAAPSEVLPRMWRYLIVWSRQVGNRWLRRISAGGLSSSGGRTTEARPGARR